MHWEGLIAEWHLPPLPESWCDKPLRLQVAYRRGLHEEAASKRYFEGDLKDLASPDPLPDIHKAVALLSSAVRQKAPVFIAGDYDVDGISSAALLAHFFARHQVPYHIRLPSREEGYGLSKKIIQEALQKRPALFISVDCGSSNPTEIQTLTHAGIPTLICDHHTVSPDPASWPCATAFVNPHRLDGSGKYQELSASGVVFKLLQAYALAEEGGSLSTLEEDIDLVGVATLADVVPLHGENRLLSRLALSKLQNAPSTGYQVLLKSLGLQGRQLESRDIVFRIVPRLNATGRLSRPEPALQLLLSNNPKEAEEIVRYLERLNRERQNLQDQALRQAKAQLEQKHGSCPAQWPNALIAAHSDWHKGVIGLVAAKLTEHYERPAAVLTRGAQTDIWVGSARSIEGIPLHKIIEHFCRPHLLKGGGHAMAAGFSVHEKHLPDFEKAFLKGVETYLPHIPRKVLTLDAEVLPYKLLEENLAEFTHAFEPAGPANPAPRYLLHQARLRPYTSGDWVVSSDNGTTPQVFYGDISFSSYRWEIQREKILPQAQALVVTPYRLHPKSPVRLKVRDIILRTPDT